MSFSVTNFEKELTVKRYPKGKFAAAIGKHPSYISEILAGTRVPDDKYARRIECVCTYLTSVEVAGQGFVFDRDGITLLKQKIREMEKSIVRSNRPTNADAPAVEESASCAN